jgi:hypothetical protein
MLAVLALWASCCAAPAQAAYLGFDRNRYPGHNSLPALRRSFRFTGFWLNNPPGEAQNSWAGKRRILKQNGFGFLVLFNGRSYAELKGKDAAALGAADGRAAVAAARREGFPANVLIFLDQEEGGGLLSEQAAYLFGWIGAVRAAGARPGVYCSAIEVPAGSSLISTAQDIVARLRAQTPPDESSRQRARLALWIADDRCPPSPGCTLQRPRLAAAYSAAPPAYTVAWQYAQSPRRAQFSAGCPVLQAPAGNCYAPGLPPDAKLFVDLDLAASPDPSEKP